MKAVEKAEAVAAARAPTVMESFMVEIGCVMRSKTNCELLWSVEEGTLTPSAPVHLRTCSVVDEKGAKKYVFFLSHFTS
jgi:hypothetical protein